MPWKKQETTSSSYFHAQSAPCWLRQAWTWPNGRKDVLTASDPRQRSLFSWHNPRTVATMAFLCETKVVKRLSKLYRWS